MPASFNPVSFTEQFVKDLQEANSLNQIKWIFDHSKMSQSEVKTKVLGALEDNNTQLDLPEIRALFEDYRQTVGYGIAITNNARLITFLNSNNNWFNLIFK